MTAARRSVLLLILTVMLGGCCSSSNLVARTLFRLRTGVPVGNDACLTRPSALDNVVLIAPFLSDYGCSLKAVMIGCTLYEDVEAASSAMMSRWDWRALPNKQRTQRAKTLVADLFHNVGPSVVPSARTAFTFEDTPEYHPMTTSLRNDNTIIVRVWTRTPPGWSTRTPTNALRTTSGPRAPFEEK